MPRLFTALTLPDPARTWLSTLRGGLRAARWIDPENYHITLRFIGDVDRHIAHDAADALNQIARAPFEVRLTGLDSFGGRKPHSIFARVEPCPPLIELQAEQERRLQRLGLPPESRRFTPHVTIARVKGATAPAIADWLAARGGFSVPPFEANHFALLSSKDSVGGGPYITEHEYKLDYAQAA
ncbi:MAG: RNA 2',3'-cyclic phosphodiesterase [Pseudomonadota bacterium]